MPGFASVLRAAARSISIANRVMAAARGDYTIADIAGEAAAGLIARRARLARGRVALFKKLGLPALGSDLAILRLTSLRDTFNRALSPVRRISSLASKLISFLRGDTFSLQAALNASYAISPIANPGGFIGVWSGLVDRAVRMVELGEQANIARVMDRALGRVYRLAASRDQGPEMDKRMLSEIEAIVRAMGTNFDGFGRAIMPENESEAEAIEARIAGIILSGIKSGRGPDEILDGIRRAGFYKPSEYGTDEDNPSLAYASDAFRNGLGIAASRYLSGKADQVTNIANRFEMFIRDPVGFTSIKSAYGSSLERFIEAEKTKLRGMATDVQKGKMSLDEFSGRFRSEIKRVQLAGMVLGAGGAMNISFAHMEIMREQTKRQMGFFNAFMDDMESAIESGDFSNRLVARAAMYADSARTMQKQAERQFMANEGIDEERRVLGPDENHCPDCPAYAELGWQPIGTLPQIGDSQCGHNCKCTFEYRTTKSEFSDDVEDVE